MRNLCQLELFSWLAWDLTCSCVWHWWILKRKIFWQTQQWILSRSFFFVKNARKSVFVVKAQLREKSFSFKFSRLKNSKIYLFEMMKRGILCWEEHFRDSESDFLKFIFFKDSGEYQVFDMTMCPVLWRYEREADFSFVNKNVSFCSES